MRAIISMTTIPSRIQHIGPAVESIRAQGLDWYVWIPQYCKRTNERFDDQFPAFLRGADGAVVADRGPATKLLSALKLGDIIITADDDVIYGETWAAGLLWYAEMFPDAALGYRGRRFYGPSYRQTHLVRRVNAPTPVDLLTGTWGVLYRAEWFDESIYDEWEEWPLNDDIVINAHLKRKGIERLVIPQRCDIEPYEACKINALWDENMHRNDTGLEKVGWFDA